MTRLQTMGIPLFADANFVPIFHKSYTQMTPEELNTIFRTQCIVCDQSAYRTQIPGVEYAFMTRATATPLSYTRLPAALTALSEARASIVRQIAAMSALPLTAQSYDALQTMRLGAASSLSLVWPSERRAFQASVTTTQASLAPTALKARIDPMLAASPSLEALRNLHDAPHRYRDLFSQVPSKQAQELQTNIGARASTMGAILIAQQCDIVRAFTGTRADLRAGATWLRSFQAVYMNNLKLPGAAEWQQTMSTRAQVSWRPTSPRCAAVS